jgi:pimeloyl-ACP methyl ester carboxylesterase
MTIFVHGWDNDEAGAHNKAKHVESELSDAGYSDKVVEYTWDSDTGVWNWDDTGWNEGKEIANGNAYALADACKDIKDSCPDMNLRLVGHSLGCRVVLRALDLLHGDYWGWGQYGYQIKSTHLLGAAVPWWWPDKDYYGDAIWGQTTACINYHAADDDVLSWYYDSYEGHDALGEHGAKGRGPCNYHDYDADSQVHGHGEYFDNLGDEIDYHMDHINLYDDDC